jgi:hypothetical protein
MLLEGAGYWPISRQDGLLQITDSKYIARRYEIQISLRIVLLPKNVTWFELATQSGNAENGVPCLEHGPVFPEICEDTKEKARDFRPVPLDSCLRPEMRPKI